MSVSAAAGGWIACRSASRCAIARVPAEQKPASCLGHLQLRAGQAPARRHVFGLVAQLAVRRRVRWDLVVIDGDPVDLHTAKLSRAAGSGGGLRQLAEQTGKRGLGIRRIGIDRRRSHRLNLADQTRLALLLVELVRRIRTGIDDHDDEAADLSLVDRAQDAGIVIRRDQRRAQRLGAKIVGQPTIEKIKIVDPAIRVGPMPQIIGIARLFVFRQAQVGRIRVRRVWRDR